MRLIAFGGDERMRGALAAAEQAGWETLHIEREEDVEMPPFFLQTQDILMQSRPTYLFGYLYHVTMLLLVTPKV